MKIIVVGGTFDFGIGKSSKLIDELSKCLDAPCVNGGNVNKLRELKVNNYFEQFDLIVWAPNISNKAEKIYPKKKKGAVLVCSKNLYNNDEERSEIDAVSRIFRMQGNAVVAIKRDNKNDNFRFLLIDALGNVWINTDNITHLAVSILKLYLWTKEAKRESLSRIDNPVINFKELQRFLDINKRVAGKCQKAFGERYFGNLSTRCTKMFPSCKNKDGLYLFSARNTNKESITLSDMVFVDNNSYYGDKKPSVDTPVQLKLYESLKGYGYKYMIHGHAYIEGACFTKNYYPCGDIREVYETLRFIHNTLVSELLEKLEAKNKYHDHLIFKAGTETAVLNLIKHGFIIMAQSLDSLSIVVENLKFVNRGIERVVK